MVPSRTALFNRSHPDWDQPITASARPSTGCRREFVAVACYSDRLLDQLRPLFGAIHHREEMRPEQFQRALERSRKAVLKVGGQAPEHRAAQNLAKRFPKHGAAYFPFLTTPGVEPTNNLAEQAIRFVVLDRRVTQGTRRGAGRQGNQRIWTTIATLTQKDRSILAYIRDAIRAYFNNQLAPALLPSGP